MFAASYSLDVLTNLYSSAVRIGSWIGDGGGGCLYELEQYLLSSTRYKPGTWINIIYEYVYTAVVSTLTGAERTGDLFSFAILLLLLLLYDRFFRLKLESTAQFVGS